MEELDRRVGEIGVGAEDLGVSRGGIGVESAVSCMANGLLSSPSLGRRDSVEPLFLMERFEGGRSSWASRRASSICRRAIWPFNSSRRSFHFGTDVWRVSRASMMEKAVVAMVVECRDRGRERGDGGVEGFGQLIMQAGNDASTVSCRLVGAVDAHESDRGRFRKTCWVLKKVEESNG